MEYYLGIDLGGTNIAAGVTDEKGKIISEFSGKTFAEGNSFQDIVRNIFKISEEAVRLAGLEMKNISAVGVGTPSCVDPRTNLLVHANNLGWRNVPLYDELKKYFDAPVFIQNDASCAALGEALYGAAAGCENALMVTLGTGVGGGIILNKKIFNGCDGMGAEIGHTKLVYDGLPCTCGQKGCFEAYASATALIKTANAAADEFSDSLLNKMRTENNGVMNGEIPFYAAKKGDKTAVEIIENYIYFLAAGIASLTAVFRPETVIIGGGISGQGDDLIFPLRKKIFELTFSASEIGIPEIIAASLGNKAGIIGAAMLCTQ